MSRTRTIALLFSLLASSLIFTLISPAHGATGSDPLTPGTVYRGNFPDPTVLRVGNVYYAHATNTGGANLPTLVSTDLSTWKVRNASDTQCTTKRVKRRGHHKKRHRYRHVKRCRSSAESFPSLGRWARGGSGSGLWAPTVAKVAGKFILGYAAVDGSGRRCIGLATAKNPLGPFVDSSPAPIVCPSDQGAIDPQVYLDPQGAPWLLWKTEGIAGRVPTKMYSRRLTPAGTAFLPGANVNTLLVTSLPWEGYLIENPALIYHEGHYLLFYSANQYRDASYATGVATCASPAGPCVKQNLLIPLLGTGGPYAGPGGATPFTDASGNLRMMFHAWDAGHVGYPSSRRCGGGCNQRRMHVANLAVDKAGVVTIYDLMGLRVPPKPPKPKPVRVVKPPKPVAVTPSEVRGPWMCDPEDRRAGWRLPGPVPTKPCTN